MNKIIRWIAIITIVSCHHTAAKDVRSSKFCFLHLYHVDSV